MVSRFALIFVSLVFVLLAAGCAKSACEDYCTSCEPSTPDCVDLCVDEYEDEGDSDCTKAFRDFADCVEKEGCGESCTSELNEYLDECDWF